MFKKKSYLTPTILISIYFNKKITVLTNQQFNSNLISIKLLKNFNAPLNLINEFNKTFAVDIATIHIKNNCITNNLFYNYKWDFYINFLNTQKIQNSYNNFFFNRVWLEREVSEFFSVFYKNLKDTRHLLLNYNENKSFLLKHNFVQANDELKTLWHQRKIIKNKNFNTEI